MSFYRMIKNSNDENDKNDILRIFNIQIETILNKHKDFISCEYDKNRNDDCYRIIFNDFYVDFIFVEDNAKNLIYEFYNSDNENLSLSNQEIIECLPELVDIKAVLQS